MKVAGVRYDEVISFQRRDTIQLSHQFIQKGLRVFVIDSMYTLRDSIDYTLNERFGKIILSSIAQTRLDTTKKTHKLHAIYYALPFQIPEKFFHKELIIQRDTMRGDTIQVSASAAPLNIDNIFGTGLQKSGYIGRGITLGTNRDLAVTSGFRLQFSGKLSSDLDIVAALTDENTPIQPEGNTATLQEIDKTFIQVNSPHLGATFGDFNMKISGSEFGSLNRKLKGIRGSFTSDIAQAEISYAKLKGTFHTNQFNGIDGVQGPYRLISKNGEQHILVIAGSERVYVDGILMTRGETNDYIIEYANGEITFKPRRLITSYSRITVDFEYADQKYERNFFSAQASTKLLSNDVMISSSFTQEGDDYDSPIDLELSEADKKLLASAGNDPTSASKSGIDYVGYDTTSHRGGGQYSFKIDTTGGGQYNYFEFDPGADSATYSLYFSYVGSGKGDYIKKSIGNFVYAGRNRGEYLPIRLLPLPQQKQIGNITLQTTPVKALFLNGEFAFSNFNQNRFSDFEKENDNGIAYKIALDFKPPNITIGNIDAGSIDLKLKLRESNRNFTPIDRINEIEFNRRWDLTQITKSTEVIREASLAYQPIKEFNVSGAFGNISRGSFFSNRIDASAQLHGEKTPRVNYSFESIQSTENISLTKGTWFRQRGDAEYSFTFITPRIRFEQENKRSTIGSHDSLTSNSFSFFDFQSGASLAEMYNMTISADYGLRNEDVYHQGSVARESHSILQTYSLRLREWKALSSSVSLTIRDKKYSEEFRLLGNKDFQNILTKAQLRYSPFNRGIDADLYYEVTTERTAKLEPVFLPRPFGYGDRKYVADRNRNGILDDSDFDPALYGDGDWVKILAPGDQLFPVLDLRTSSRVRISPARFLTSGLNWWEEALTKISTETFYRIDEKSSEERTSKIYFMHLSNFLNDSTTIRGLQTFTQDIFLFENEQNVSFRFRFDQRKGFGQYALQNERSYRREKSVRMRSRLIEEIGLQLDYARTSDAVSVSQVSTRARTITSDNFVLDLSYRPSREIEVGLVLNAKTAKDEFPKIPVDAQINAQTLRCNYSFTGQGRARFEIERNEVILSNVAESFPFELTDGKVQGKSWIVRINIDYRITNFLQATMSYLGRIENDRPAIHTARAEVRTFF